MGLKPKVTVLKTGSRKLLKKRKRKLEVKGLEKESGLWVKNFIESKKKKSGNK